MALDADGHSKGFAFVEFEEEVGSFYQEFYFFLTLTYFSRAGRRREGSRG